MYALALAALVALQTSPEAPDQPFEVVVPFGCGRSFPVSQSHNTGSHLQNDAWAWDFRMPEGTPIVAAADGVVRLARGDSTRGACDPRYARFANYIVIEHGDGLETQYLHFRKVLVQPGDRVKAGQLVGYSGQTGWACGAHLHFKVARTEQPGWNNPSVPARIAGYGDPAVETIVAAPACKAPEVQIVETAAVSPKDDAPAASSAKDAVTQATSTPDLTAAGVQAAAAPAADVAAPVGKEQNAAGGSAAGQKK